jgi:hypothetical protein
MKAIDITGRRFGRLIAMESVGSTIDGRRLWLCRCDCGIEKSIRGKTLRRGETRSCGCLHQEAVHNRMTTHGATINHKWRPEYRTWVNVKTRCLNPKFKDFHLYGGRGITICDKWRDNFAAFFADMGPKPAPEYSIDRIDPDGHYQPDNCRWATWAQQRRNQREHRALASPGRREP